MDPPIKFPIRLHGFGHKQVIRLPRSMGGSAKVFLRETAKTLPEYRQPISCGISGHTDTGKEIPINSVGRWLFGVPGYMGHIRVSNWEGCEANIEWPSDAPDVVQKLIAKLKTQVEGEAVSEPSDEGNVLEKAMSLIQRERSQASIQKKAAFANSVQILVTGWSGGYGGPSIREHAVSYLYGDRAGQYDFQEAVELLIHNDGPIFGPLTRVHRTCWENEYCFDDDPVDLEQLNS